MVVLSLNSRGLGSALKQKLVKSLLLQYKVDLVCLQETKLQEVDQGCCRRIWGDADFEWEFVPAVNRGGRLLCLWRKGFIQVTSCMKGQNFICMAGRIVAENLDCVFLNIYAPCDRGGKRALWDSLVDLKDNINSDFWCALGDFNAVRYPEERKGSGNPSNTQRMESAEFNEFIEGMEMLDIPLIGRRFTWVRPNGSQMSRLDIILVSPSWFDKWSGFVQEVLQRDISDHCPLLLRISYQNWGPKPFRFLNCWFDDKRFRGFVEKTWHETKIEGRGAFVLMEKLKVMKTNLKKWNLEVFGDVNRKKKKAADILNELEKKAEVSDLGEEELKQRREYGAEFWKRAKQAESLACQKAKIKWVKEGDANTKFFHAMINFRRKTNSLTGLNINGEWCEDPRSVKKEVLNFFAQKFRTANKKMPLLDGVPFNSLSNSAAQSLEEKFTVEELKLAVWGCASDKSPGLDGVNFMFIKNFWEIINEDFSRLADEFYENGIGLVVHYIDTQSRLSSRPRRIQAYLRGQQHV